MTEISGKVPAKTIEELYKNHEFYIGLGLAVSIEYMILSEIFQIILLIDIVECIHWVKFYHQEEGLDQIESNRWLTSISWWFWLFERMDLVGWFTYK